jgi:hypothetical protein
VSTTTEELRVKLLDAKKAETELRSVRKELEKTTGSTSSSGKAAEDAAEGHHRLAGALGGLKSALMYGGGLIGLAGVGYGLKDITEGGIQAQERQLLLQQSLRQTGQAGSKHMGELHAAITKTSSSGGFSALEETEGLAQLVRETKSTTKAIQDNRSAIALARGAHEDYGAALSQVERIETGQVGRLQKYLGIIQPVKYYVDQLTASEKKRFPQKVKEAELLDKEATAREANRRILERYGGAVNAYNKSTAGSISNANNAFKQATEQLGEKLLPAETAVAKEFSKLITEIMKGEGVWKTVGKDIGTVWKDLEGVYHFLEQHKELAKLLGYGAVAGIGTSILKKAPGAGLLKKVLTAGGGAEEGAEGAAALSNPATVAALAAGVGTLVASNKAIKAATEAISPGYLKQRSLGEVEHALFGNPNLRGGFGNTSLGGKAARGKTTPAEASLVSRILEHPSTLTPQTELSPQSIERLEKAVERAMASHNHAIELDGQKLGQALVNNRHLRRGAAEATTKHVQIKKTLE